jgi:hypothetical protein
MTAPVINPDDYRRNIARLTDGAAFGSLPNDRVAQLWPVLDGGGAP